MTQKEELRIYKLFKHQLRLARSSDASITDLAKPLKHELANYISKDEILKARPAKSKVSTEPDAWHAVSGHYVTPEEQKKRYYLLGHNQALKYWSKAMGIGE